jgi:hypothetical protein
MNPPPVTAAAPFETQHQDQQQESLLPASQVRIGGLRPLLSKLAG